MKQMPGVYRGVLFVYYGLYLIIASALLMILGVPLAVTGGSLAGLLLVSLIVTTGFLLGTLLGALGRFACLDTPDDFSSKGLIFGAVGLDIACICFNLVSYFTELPPTIAVLNYLCSLVASILFIVFLKQVAKHIDDSKSAMRASNVLNLGIGAAISLVVGIFLPPLIILTFLLLLIGFLMYVWLLQGLRSSLKPV